MSSCLHLVMTDSTLSLLCWPTQITIKIWHQIYVQKGLSVLHKQLITVTDSTPEQWVQFAPSWRQAIPAVVSWSVLQSRFGAAFISSPEPAEGLRFTLQFPLRAALWPRSHRAWGRSSTDCLIFVLPSAYINSDRYKRQNMHYIISVCNRIGHFDKFLIKTCNLNWPGIKASFVPGREPQERPDRSARVSHINLRALMARLLLERLFLGKSLT